MSGVVRTVKKAFNNKIVKTIVIAAAIWYTAGVASAYFSAASPGLGAAMSASGESMWATATSGSFVSGADIATGAFVPGGTVAGAGGGAIVGTPITSTEGVGALSATDVSIAAGEKAMMANSVAGTMPPAVAAPPASTGLVGGAAKWMGNNPIPTMILGQAGVGAYSGYLEEKAAADARSDAERERTDRGTRGYDWQGNYAGQPGIVQSQQVAAPQTAAQAVAAPNVQTPTARPVNRNNLPQLQKQGLVAPNRTA